MSAPTPGRPEWSSLSAALDPEALLDENARLRGYLSLFGFESPAAAKSNVRSGMWMQTHTGRRVYPAAMTAADVDIADIAHSLAMQCRYNGHIDRF
ncbi:hypothetical protein, partial [Enterococcus faecium]